MTSKECCEVLVWESQENMGRCTDRRDMTKADESGVKLQTNNCIQTKANVYDCNVTFPILYLQVENFRREPAHTTRLTNHRPTMD